MYSFSGHEFIKNWITWHFGVFAKMCAEVESSKTDVLLGKPVPFNMFLKMHIAADYGVSQPLIVRTPILRHI